MRNITITVTDEVARWARIWAAKHNTSVSQLVGEVLRQYMFQEEGYESAMRQFLKKKPTRLKNSGSYPHRQELYER